MSIRKVLKALQVGFQSLQEKEKEKEKEKDQKGVVGGNGVAVQCALLPGNGDLEGNQVCRLGHKIGRNVAVVTILALLQSTKPTPIVPMPPPPITKPTNCPFPTLWLAPGRVVTPRLVSQYPPNRPGASCERKTTLQPQLDL